MLRGLYVLVALSSLAGAGMFWAGKAALATPAETVAVTTDDCSTCCTSAKVCDLCGDPSCPLTKSDCAACCASGCPDCAAGASCPVCGTDCCPCCDGGK